MAELEVERFVPVAAEAVFRVASDPARLQEWLPTASHTQRAGPDQVRVEGTAHGEDYVDEGFWRPRPEQLRVEWGTPSRGGEPSEYDGWLQVSHADGGCSVSVHLSFQGSQDRAHQGDAGHEAEADLERALQQLGELAGG